MTAPYTPPPGGLVVGNPRSPFDILLRTTAIHAFAILAYYNLLRLLPALWQFQSSLLRRDETSASRAGMHGPLRLIPHLAGFALLPGFLLAQIGLRLVLPLLLRRTPFTYLLSLKSPLSSQDAATALLFTGLAALPLLNAFGGYRARLKMTYQAATYIGNLGLDHRNGWTGAAGLAAAGITLTCVLLRTLLGSSNDLDSAQEEGPEDKAGGERDTAEGMATHLASWGPLAEAGIATAIQQPLLAVTNHITPAHILLTVWPLLPVMAGVLWSLQRRRRWHMQDIALLVVASFVLATVFLQAFWDAWEFVNATHGRAERYNYRWAVKDNFSKYSPPV